MPYRALILVISACTFIALSVNGCQGGNDGVFNTPVDQSETTITTDPEPVTAFPGFPAADEADGAPRIVAAQDNILTGSEAYANHASATISDTDLVLDSTSDRAVWGVWRWGTFGGSVVPLTVELDVDAGGGEYWLAVSYYRDMEWRIIGPLTDSAYIHTYEVGINHVSPTSGYSYVVLLADEGNVLTVHSLNMTADDDVQAPAAPTGLIAAQIEGTRIQLTWDANAEADLDGYNLFSGPSDGFDITDPSAEDLGSVDAATTSFWVEDLEGDTDYHFRITAFDALGNESPPSATCNATTLAAPTYPTNLHVTAVGGSTTSVAWDEPAAGTPLGYEIYTGPAVDFEVGDTGVIKHNTALVTNTHYTLTGLAGNTEYHCRVRAYYPAGTSALSNTATFSTLENAAPKPSFTVSPQFVESGETVLFNPAGTTDDDTPLEDLIFRWDYDNDGTDDYETTGPEIVEHVYHVRGPMTTKLTVVDGAEFFTTRDFVINFNYEYYQREPATGSPGEIIALDTDPATSRIAVLFTAGDSTLVEYYSGTTWSEYDASNINCSIYSDISLTPDGFAVLVTLTGDGPASWSVYSNNLTNWSLAATDTIDEDIVFDSSLDVGSNGRLSVAVLEGYATGTQTVVLHYLLYIWHEMADTTYYTDNITLINDLQEEFDVKRNDTTSYFIYGRGGSMHLWEVTDSTDSDTTVQSYSGDCKILTTSLDPANDTQVSWAFVTTSPRIYYGDNFGTANGTQYHTPANTPAGLAGCGLAGDNEALVYWVDEQADGTQRLLEYDSITGGGTESVITSAPGLAEFSRGEYYDDGSSTGVYTCVDEFRDGELCGRLCAGGSIDYTETVYVPASNDANVIGVHIPLVFANDSVLCIDEQEFGSARASYATSVNGPFSDAVYGDNNWCRPVTACVEGAGSDFFIATYRDVLTDPVLDINLYSLGTSTGTTKASITSTTMPHLAHHPTSDEVLLFTLNSAGTNLDVRTWSGTTWSAPTNLHSGGDVIESYAVAPKGAADWGVAFVDEVENTRLIETSSGTWGSASVISTETVNGSSGVSLGYKSDGSLAVAVERWVVQAGVYLGTGPDGSSLTWERIATTTGSEVRSIFVDYYNESPLVLYYLRKTPSRNSRVQIVEYFDSAWNVSELPDQLHGYPTVGYALDSNGNIVIAGYNMSAEPRYSSIGILLN